MVEEKSEKKSTLARWSKRKLEQKQVSVKQENAPDPLTTSELEKNQQALEIKHHENRQAAEAINFDTLNFESDFSIFMKEGVPEALRRKAQRLLWRSNPILANLDGLNDYDDDFADPSLILKSFKSAWEIGKGYANKEVPEKEEKISEPVEDAPATQITEQDQVSPPDTETVEEEFSEEEPELLPALEDTDGEVLAAQVIEAPAKVSLRKRHMLGSTDDG